MPANLASFAIHVDDVDRARRFYEAIFGWQFEPWGPPGFYLILTGSIGAKAWPIAGATFILLPKQPKDTAATGEALKFFAWAYKNGAKMAPDLDYIPMPDSVVKQIETVWKNDINDDSGKANV